MKITKILISMLAVSALGIGIAACSGDDDDDGANPVFSDPAANTVRKDRMGRPAINTIIRKVLNTTGSSSDAFNGLTPPQDEALSGALGTIVNLLHACPPATLGSALLPDVLTINTTPASGYLNGRDLDDDVIDLTLQSVYSTNGGVSYCLGTNAAAIESTILTDHIDANDKSFLTTFPYLAAPN